MGWPKLDWPKLAITLHPPRPGRPRTIPSWWGSWGCEPPSLPLWGRRGFTRQPENSKRAQFRPRRSKHHQNSTRRPPREGKEKMKIVVGREKKCEILGGVRRRRTGRGFEGERGFEGRRGSEGDATSPVPPLRSPSPPPLQH